MTDRSPPDDGDFLRLFGERLRGVRARRGMSRRLLAAHAGISERYIAQVESGRGNVSILLLRQIAAALGEPLPRLLGEDESPEGTLLRQFLARLSPAQLRDAHELLASRFTAGAGASRSGRIALIGLRGAGKTTLGTSLARSLDLPFHELDREVERLSGTSLGTVIEMYGQAAYRRYELQALRELLQREERFVVAAGGSIVAEPETWELLLRNCFTVWLRATPDEHMARVVAQGDRRPMAGSTQAMDDLKRILEERSPLYARADATLDTAGRSVEESARELRRVVEDAGTGGGRRGT